MFAPETMEEKREKVQRKLFLRYIAGVFFSLFLVGSQLYLVFWDVGVADSYGSLINRAGSQRRLSQTIALKVSEITNVADPRETGKLRMELEEAVETMEAEYLRILSDIFESGVIDAPMGMFELHFGTGELRELHRTYLEAAKEVVDDPVPAPEDTHVRYVIERNSELLALLAENVHALESGLIIFGRGVFMLELLLLALGGIGVFLFWVLILRPVLQRLRKEKELNVEMNVELQSFLSRAFAVVFKADTEGVVTEVTENSLRVYGYTRDDVIGKHLLEFVSPRQKKMVAKAFALLSKGKTIDNLQVEILDSEDIVRQTLVNASPVEVNGEFHGVVGTILDITSQQASEEELRAERLKNEILIKQGGLLAYDYDIITGKIVWSGSIFDVTGFTDADFPGQNIDTWAEMIRPDDRAEVTRLLERAEKNLESFTANYGFRHANGTYRSILDKGVFIADESGKKAARMIGIMIDVTDFERITKDLAQSQEKFRNAFSSSPIGFAIVALDGAWLEVNAALLEIVGYSKEELLKLTFQDITHPDDLSKDLELVQKVIDGKLENYQMEKRYFKKDGSVVWALLSVSMVRDSDGKPEYFVSQIQDISEEKEIAQRMQELNELKNTFIRTVSHQLRTPLSSLRWNLDMLLSEEVGKLTDEQREFLRLSVKADDIVIRVLHDLLTVMDIEEGRVHLSREDVSLEGIIASEIAEFEKEAERKKLTLEFSKPKAGLPHVSVDIPKFKDAVSHLLRNAIWYTPEGGKVTVSVKVADGEVRVAVKDTGIGIPDEEQERVFENFYRATNAVKMETDASGVGLGIAKHYIEEHGGKLEMESKLNGGSTFTLVLPSGGSREDKKKAAVRKTTASKKPAVKKSKSRKKKA